MRKLQATTLNGQMMLREENTFTEPLFEDPEYPDMLSEWEMFEKSVKAYPADIPGLKDGDILDSEDCDLVWQYQGKSGVNNGRWFSISEYSYNYRYKDSIYNTRQAYILKSQPSLKEGKEETPMLWYDEMSMDNHMCNLHIPEKYRKLVAKDWAIQLQRAYAKGFEHGVNVKNHGLYDYVYFKTWLEQQGYTITKQP